MGSIVTTRVVTWLTGSPALRFAAFRSDDVVKLVTALWTQPANFQVDGTGAALVAGLVVAGGLACGVLLAAATYAVGALLARAAVMRSASLQS
jgi:hypothetical protein